jgi:small subunit ribosomal protein S20
MLSRINPVIRESRVSALTADSVLSRFMQEPPPLPARTSARVAICGLREARRRSHFSQEPASATRSSLRESRKMAIMPGLFRRLQQASVQHLAQQPNPVRRQVNARATKDFIEMANTAQARKRARQAEVTRQHNASLKSSLRTAIKKVRKAISAGDKAAATKELQTQQAVIDRIADKKVVHKNTASRSKARLAQAIKALP